MCRALDMSLTDGIFRGLGALPLNEQRTYKGAGGHPGRRRPSRTIVAASQLVQVVLCSRKPEAHEFQGWVLHKALLGIRGNGMYVASQRHGQPESNPLHFWPRYGLEGP